jgi:uncharacterized protein (TIGR02646 family)
MRYIQKVDVPKFFIDDTEKLTKWDEYYANKKRVLKEYILDKEQNYLCIYCENKINSTKESSHLDVATLKHLDIENLTFEYNNIAVSCNGNCENNSSDTKNYNCGHRKDRDDTPYDNEKFLNPLIEKDIRDYFEYDLDDYLINPSNKDIQKAQYMRDTLHLNDGGLPEARKKALKAFREEMVKTSDITIRKEKMRKILMQENKPFISLLIFKYKNLLEK